MSIREGVVEDGIAGIGLVAQLRHAYVSIRTYASCIRMHKYVCLDAQMHRHGRTLADSVTPDTSAYVSTRQHTSAYVIDTDALSPIQAQATQQKYEYVRTRCRSYMPMSTYVSMRQHPSAYVSIRLHTSSCVSIRERPLETRYASFGAHPPAYYTVDTHSKCAYAYKYSICQHTSVSIRHILCMRIQSVHNTNT